MLCTSASAVNSAKDNNVPFMFSHIPEFIEAENFAPSSVDLSPVDFPLWAAFHHNCTVNRRETLIT